MTAPPSKQPLRIALLGWARLSAQAAEGSGYNLNCSELAAGLAARGHKVFYLRSGREYSFRPRIFIKRHETWRNIECHDLFNSPNFSHAWFNFHNMCSEIASERTCRVVLEWLKRANIEVVHIHSLEGYSLDLPRVIENAGIRVVITPHNHWYVCPEVDLLYQDHEICTDYDGGRRCETCVQSWKPSKWRIKQKFQQGVERTLGKGGMAALWRMNYWRRSARTAVTGAPLVPADTALAAINPVATDIPADQNERFLAARDIHLRVLNEYGQRRIAGIEALKSASMVTPPSAWLTELLTTLGVPRERCRQVRLGQPHFDRLREITRKSPEFDRVPWTPASDRPLRFGFLGTTKHNKGLQLLAQTIAILPHETLARTEFIIHATGAEPPCRALLQSFKNVHWRGRYDTANLASIFKTFDIGLHPHVGFDNSPFILLEYLNSGKFVVVSRLGGPMEWVRDGQNGVLFSPSLANGNELAQTITRIIDGEIAVPTPRQVQDASRLQSHATHVEEIESIYREVLASESNHATNPAALPVST